jgi:hypothetical protein
MLHGPREIAGLSVYKRVLFTPQFFIAVANKKRYVLCSGPGREFQEIFDN